MRETHDDVIREKKLPRVGQTVRSKNYGNLWRVMEKREVWQNTTDDPDTGNPRMIPAIYLSYWRIKKGVLTTKSDTQHFSRNVVMSLRPTIKRSVEESIVQPLQHSTGSC
jgi:hypothetical protein